MLSWLAYKNEAKARGALALECYMLISLPTQEGALVKQHLADHLAYQAKQEAEGKLMFAGPLSDLSGEYMEGAGMIIYRTQTLDEARKIADQDPMHLHGARTYSLRRWLINEGSMQLDLKLSAQSVKLGLD
ncbi:hypothetical protein MED121_19469 [Marinomonas sp. MED121]|uniref:YciI family protein n=1 Tax=Marinomonas sp. MED121 TaxID=314277 RepID=UPI0000690ED2|nr:YciI family protein [Marinomonas sp. MED121]EAQ64289.1 hypothetical protein MED121_19469 [Marinomonas sp. MED121]